jgi:hypothetical protein
VKSFGADLYGWFDLESLPIMQSARRQRIMSAMNAFQMGVPFNAVNQVYQLGFPNFAWGNDAYLPTNVQKVGTWAQPRNVAAEVTRRMDGQLVNNPPRHLGGYAQEPVAKMLELLETTTPDCHAQRLAPQHPQHDIIR